MKNASKTPSILSTCIVLVSFAAFWLVSSLIFVTREEFVAAIYLSVAILVPLVLFGSIIVYRDTRRRRMSRDQSQSS